MNRNSKLFSLLAVVFALALSVVLVGCGQQASSSAASSSASSASASSAAVSSSAASSSASSEASSAASASASASSAASDANEVTFTMKIDATEADKGMLYDGGGTVEKGTTVYQALVDTNLPLSVDASSGSAYVYGIGDVVVNDSKAGWMFTVNGEMPSLGADKVEIADGDVIEWKYYADATKAM
jgi:cytoskeletal protein RodZ